MLLPGDACGASNGSPNSDGRVTTGGGMCPGSSDGPRSDIPVMVSGAGHDAMAIAEVTRMGMVFVRCRGGVSHSPLEHVEPEDVAAAAAALYHYIVNRG